MKMNIKEIDSTPHVLWNKFIEFLSDNIGNESQYTPIQKVAALCFWYHAEMCSGGHSGYFDCYSHVDKDELVNALHIIGASGFAKNFIEAYKYGKKDDYQKTDDWFLQK